MMSRLIGGILLVAGTTIGGAMLAAPISTGMAGFIPSLLLFAMAWFFMTFTALLVLEVNLWMKGDVNLITMARRTLGRPGEMLSWICYLFLLYALMTAYIAASGPIFVVFMEFLSGLRDLPRWIGALPLLAIFGFFVYKGTRAVDTINRLLMVGLVVVFALLVVFVMPHVDTKLLMHHDICFLPLATSVVFTSFGFHIIIPSLTTYMHHDVRMMRLAILIGSAIPLFAYILWELLTLGVVPLEGKLGIRAAFTEGANGASVLALLLDNPRIALLAHFFSFFAIVTSFLGVSLSLSHFLADGLKVKKTRGGRIALLVLTFAPPWLISLSYPRAFLTALEYAGAYGVVTLLCFLPALMVWRGRYRLNIPWNYRAPGGKTALIAVIIGSLIVMILEAFNKLGLLSCSGV